MTFFITRNDRQRFSSQTVDFNFNWPLKSRLVAGETLAQPLVEFWIIRLPDFIADVDAQKIHVAVAETQLGQFLAGGFETWFLNFINPSAFFFFIVAIPAGARERFGEDFYQPLIRGGIVKVVEGATRDAMAHADVTLAASGTVAMEAALLGAPLVSFYRVTPLTWHIGRPLVNVPFYTMVNLVAGRRVIPELIQDEMTGERIASEALALLESESARVEMKAGLQEVAQLLASQGDPLEVSARRIAASLEGENGR